MSIGLNRTGVTSEYCDFWTDLCETWFRFKKLDAITEFHREIIKTGYMQPEASDLLFYVGRQTIEIAKILGSGQSGNPAESDEKLLESHFGKIGNVLWAFRKWLDEDPVCKEGYEAPVKSIGNSTTTLRDSKISGCLDCLNSIGRKCSVRTGNMDLKCKNSRNYSSR